MISTLEKTIHEMMSGVYDYTREGECSGCGQCCTALLPLFRTEFKEIERLVRKRKIKPCRHDVGIPYSGQIDFDLTCPFRDNVNRKCIIYDHRPLVCRNFRCDKPKKRIEADKRFYEMKMNVVNMWGFFA